MRKVVIIISKYHHLIPQTYLSAWANGSGTLKIKWIDSNNIEMRNKSSIGGINHYHSIVAGMPFCNKEDTDKFFASLFEYDVFLDGEILKDSIEMNKHYGRFDEWIIKRPNGSRVSNRHLKSQIDRVKIQDIEEQWSKQYEDKWNKVRDIIEYKVADADKRIPAFYFGYLMRFFISLDWRSITLNSDFNNMVNCLLNDTLDMDMVNIPEEENTLHLFENMTDYMKHCLLLNYFREFLNDSGVIYKHAKISMANLTFGFLIATGKEKFITSDNPAFITEVENSMKIGILPITPEILMIQVKKNNSAKEYLVNRINDYEVKTYNKYILDNASEFVVVNN